MATVSFSPLQTNQSNMNILQYESLFMKEKRNSHANNGGRSLNPIQQDYVEVRKTQQKITDLTNVLTTAGIGTWSFDSQTRRLHLCPVANKLTGLQNEELNTGLLMRRMREWQLSPLIEIARSAYKNGYSFEKEIQLPKTGISGEKWLKVTGKLYRSEDRSLTLMGTIMDISSQKTEEIRKKDLMAFMNHELKTPLSVIKLYVQNAASQASKESNASIADKMLKADRQTVTMSKLIDNFLILSQVENSSLILHKTSFDLYQLIQGVVSDMAFLHPDYFFKIDLSPAIMVCADSDKIIQVLTNYITNAIKFSPEKSSIHISVKKRSNQVVVNVKDNGAGIKNADQGLLFNRYCRVNTHGSIRAKGFGLGLFLSREIIESHDGNVWLKSKPDQGSIFSFCLPLKF